jgi:uncharacterized protein YqgC (DUF456 family)
MSLLQGLGNAAVGTAVTLLCIGGVLLSCLSISGTWLVAGAAAIAAVAWKDAFPGPWTVAVFLALCIAVEAWETVAGAWGVRRRGGSAVAGFAAVAGGMLGLLAGAALPVPVFGPLLGMAAGSFGLVFVVEVRRLRRADQAASIAWGSVLARISVVLVKVAVTLGMVGYLLAGMFLG